MTHFELKSHPGACWAGRVVTGAGRIDLANVFAKSLEDLKESVE
jgi:hypothetical protein